jgi:hypothetical protein
VSVPKKRAAKEKKRAAKEENDSPRRWFVYNRSLWMMKRPNHRRGNPASCSKKEGCPTGKDSP